MPLPVRLLVPLSRLQRRPAVIRAHLNAISGPFRRPPTTPQRAASSSDLPEQFTQFTDAVRNRRLRNLRRLLTGVTFGGLGYAFGTFIISASILYVFEPGSAEDVEELELLREEFEEFDEIRNLKGIGEYVQSDPFSDLSQGEKEEMLITGPLKGSRGVNLMHVHFGDSPLHVVAYFHLGPGLEGHEELQEARGVVHRGALSTVMDEVTRRLAMRVLPSQTPRMSKFQLLFGKPVHSGQFVSTVAKVNTDESTDQELSVAASLEDESGAICAVAIATFVVPEEHQSEEIGDTS